MGPTRTLLIQRGRCKHQTFSKLATVHASSCHPLLEFIGFDAGLCRALLAQSRSLPIRFISALRPSFNSDGSTRGELRIKSVLFAEAERRLPRIGAVP